MAALELHAGAAAHRHLREHGLRPADVAAVLGAAAGPKGLVFNHLDRWLFADWLPRAARPVHLLGASIGAWRFVQACRADPRAALAELAHDYAHESYALPGRSWPTPEHVSAVMRRRLAAQLAGREAEVLASPHYRLHLLTSAGRHRWLRDGGRLGTAAGYAAAVLSNAVSRRALGRWLERVLWSDPRAPLPFALDTLPERRHLLTAANLREVVLASCSIPFWLAPVRGIPDGGADVAHWDGGITDYHPCPGGAVRGAPLVLYPHAYPYVVPGWLDKRLPYRRASGAGLSNLVLLVPGTDFVRSLPGGRIPERADFRRYGDDVGARAAAWMRAVAEGERLAEAFARLVEQGPGVPVQLLH